MGCQRESGEVGRFVLDQPAGQERRESGETIIHRDPASSQTPPHLLQPAPLPGGRRSHKHRSEVTTALFHLSDFRSNNNILFIETIYKEEKIIKRQQKISDVLGGVPEGGEGDQRLREGACPDGDRFLNV